MEIPVLFVGQAERGEFRRVLAQLRTVSRLITAPDLPAAQAVLSQHPSIRRILLAPSYRDEFPADALGQLVGRQPLAEMFVLVGPWLEGETRSGHPWLAAQRLYLHQLVPWLRCSPPDRGPYRPRRAAHGDRPRCTPTRPGNWPPQAPWPRPTGRVVLCGELPESRQSLAAVCTAAGLRFVATRSAAAGGMCRCRRGGLRGRLRSHSMGVTDSAIGGELSASCTGGVDEFSAARRMRMDAALRRHRGLGKALPSGPFARQPGGASRYGEPLRGVKLGAPGANVAPRPAWGRLLG